MLHRVQCRRQWLVLVELLSSLWYQRQTVTSFVNRHRNGFVFGLIVILLLCGLTRLELQVPELTAVDDDDISNCPLTLASNCEASGTADAADFLSLLAPTALTDDVTKDIALPMSHRGLSRTRKVNAQRFQDTVTRTESCRNGGAPIESVSDSAPRDLLHRLCIQRI
jgi:hypothetical protein